MEILIILIVGLLFGIMGAVIYVKERQKKVNRERWRKYAANRKAKRGR